ncbi:hypothetical protein B1757_11160 [Acidithiobacillus marinus]|uniref:Uncharacterized protein n=1 Tax=Acidithiobacillus marinus TaxID=187490 RepID=A0A2I1DJV3_9PROT|nr:hypothetical protein B1757_11160 [Acidithiobacillus marinus]
MGVGILIFFLAFCRCCLRGDQGHDLIAGRWLQMLISTVKNDKFFIFGQHKQCNIALVKVLLILYPVKLFGEAGYLYAPPFCYFIQQCVGRCSFIK